MALQIYVGTKGRACQGPASYGEARATGNAWICNSDCRRRDDSLLSQVTHISELMDCGVLLVEHLEHE